MVKIAISGKIGAGKSTLANALLDKYKLLSKTTTICSFADPIKKIAYECFLMPKDPLLKNRKLLQDIGQSMKQIDKHVWVKAFINQIETYTTSNVICDDLRFENEAIALKKAGFILIRLNISKEKQIERLKNTYPFTWEQHVEKLNDVSEISLDNFTNFDLTFCIENLNDEIHLCDRVFNAIKKVKRVQFKV